MADDSLGIGSLRRPEASPTRVARPAAPAPAPTRTSREPAAAPAPPPAAPPPGSTVDLLFSRHSIASLTEPGPSDAQLDTMLRAATTVPDHGGLRPWRFAVIRGAGRERFGDALAAAATEAGADAGGVRDKALKAPTLAAVIFAPRVDSKIPEWEQMTSAAAAGYAITLAAHALGVGAAWRSTEHMDGAAVRRLLGMAASDRMLGWVLLGTPAGDPPDEPRDTPNLDELVTWVE